MPKAMEEGAAARRQGLPPTANPYPWRRRAECLAWVWGYTTTGTDLAREQAAAGGR